MDKNKGQGAARNLGLDHAKGEYVLFVDSDDFINLQTVEQLIGSMRDKEVDVIRFNAKSFSDEGERIKEKEYNFNHFMKENKSYTKRELTSVYLSYSPSPVLYLFKKEIIEKNKIRFKESIIHEDELFSTLLFLHAKSFSYINRSFYNRRYRKGSTMTKKDLEQKIYSFNSYLKILCEYEQLLNVKKYKSLEKNYLNIE